MIKPKIVPIRKILIDNKTGLVPSDNINEYKCYFNKKEKCFIITDGHLQEIRKFKTEKEANNFLKEHYKKAKEN